MLTSHQVNEYLTHFRLGKLLELTRLESGFESDNVRIKTEKGTYVMRVIYQTTNRIYDTMKIYDLLVANGIKTAKPIKTKEGKYFIEISPKESLVIQNFIIGKPYFREYLEIKPELYEVMLKLYGKELGKFHKISTLIFNSVNFKEIDPENSTVKDILKMNPNFLRMSDSSYVQSEYDKWVRGAKRIEKYELSFGITHDDIKPGDFFLVDNELSGILDFNAARFDYLLSDLAAFIMYCNMYLEENKSRFMVFITPYLENSPVSLEELKHLQFFFKTRAFLQVFYFTYRIQTNTLQGVNSEEDNLEGVSDGIEFLKAANMLPSDYFYKLAINELKN